MTDVHIEVDSRHIAEWYEVCYVCNGSGMQLKCDGEPGLCKECKGDTVLDKDDHDG